MNDHKYPNIKTLDPYLNVHRLESDDFVYAWDLESRLHGIRRAYGLGSETAGSFAYGPDLNPAVMQKSCFIFGMQDTKVETAESIAKEIEEKSHSFLQSAEGVQELKRLADRLAAKVLR